VATEVRPQQVEVLQRASQHAIEELVVGAHARAFRRRLATAHAACHPLPDSATENKNPPGYGGIEQVVQLLSGELVERGHRRR
jgi:hypothetical protein